MDTTQYPFYRHLKCDAFTISVTETCREIEGRVRNLSPIFNYYYTETPMECQANNGNIPN